MRRQFPARKSRVNPRRLSIKFDNFAKGLNTLVAPTKIRDDELSTANNVLLVDEGSPGRRWGTATYGDDSGGTKTDKVFAYYPSTSSSELLKVEDGILRKLSGSSWTNVTGASFTTNVVPSAAQTSDLLYISNGVDALTKYDGSGLLRFSGIATPSAPSSITRGASLASGNYQYSYKVTAVNSVGETPASGGTTVQVNKLREDWNPNDTIDLNYAVTVNWSTVADATGYNIYVGQSGDELYVKHVAGGSSVSWVDNGTLTPNQFAAAPVGDTTVGPKGKYITEYKTSLLIGGDPSNPSRVWYSAGVDRPDDFTLGSGGGFVDISKDSDDGVVKGLATFQDQAIIFKERSIWQFAFTNSAFVSVKNIIKGLGCISNRTIKEVENDLLFLGRKPGGGPAILVLGNEPNYLNVLRTNEVSARVRPELQSLVADNFELANALYIDGKYFLFFAAGGSTFNNQAIIYDRERLGFVKWTNIYINDSIIYYEPDNDEKIIYVDGHDNRVSEISSDYTTDKGAAISWVIKTKEADLKEPFDYKRFRTADVRLRNVAGKIDFRLVTDVNSFSYSATVDAGIKDTAFGHWQFGVGQFGTIGTSEGDNPTADVVRRLPVRTRGVNAVARSLGIEISGTTSSSKATLLDAHIEADPRSSIYYPRSERLDIFNE